MKAKVAFGEDVRHWHYPSQNRLQHLVSFVEQTLKTSGSQKKKEYYFQFEDSEKDKITISNEQDLLDAFECAEQEKRPSLKIYVTQGSITETHEGFSHLTKEKKETEENDNDVPSSEKCVGSDSSNSCCNWQKLGLEFLLDEKVMTLLPELILRVIGELRENMRSNKQASLVEVVPRVLEEKTFEDIVRHEVYQKYIKPLLPLLLMKASCFTNVLLNLNEECIVTRLSDIVNVVTMSLADESPNFHHLWGGLLNILHGDHHEMKDENGQVIHRHVECDVCKTHPIKGIRYKCSVCPDYDLCEKCESSSQHDPGHPLVKIIQPICRRRLGENRFVGLHEMMGKHCRRRRCGRRNNEGHFGGHCPARFRTPCWMKFAVPKEQKKKDKLENRKEKLIKKLAKLDSKLNKGSENPSSQNDCSMKIKCICGEWLVQTTANKAYHYTAQVICDRCSTSYSNDDIVFHCPVKKCSAHPCGYDVCFKCAAESISNVNNEKKVDNEVKNEEVSVANEKKEEIIVEKSENVVEEQEKKEKPKENEQQKPEEKQAKNEEIPNFRKFEYVAEANQLIDMGFKDQELIIKLLLEKKGNLDEVLTILLS